MVSNIYSNKATNFVGAQRELQTLEALFKLQQFKKQFIEKLVNCNITWHFITARSPHVGGSRAERSKMSDQTCVVGNALLTFEEIYTLLACIEAYINFRPLCPL